MPKVSSNFLQDDKTWTKMKLMFFYCLQGWNLARLQNASTISKCLTSFDNNASLKFTRCLYILPFYLHLLWALQTTYTHDENHRVPIKHPSLLAKLEQDSATASLRSFMSSQQISWYPSWTVYSCTLHSKKMMKDTHKKVGFTCPLFYLSCKIHW